MTVDFGGFYRYQMLKALSLQFGIPQKKIELAHILMTMLSKESNKRLQGDAATPRA